MSLTPAWRPITKRTLDFFGRWGDPRTNLRSMLSGIMPVAVVDRFRDDDEGSIYGINCFARAQPAEFPAVCFGSTENDWELLSVTALWVDWNLQNFGVHGCEFHFFTPINPYNPCVNIDPPGFFLNGLLTNRAFTFGTVTAIGGSNPAIPSILGPTLNQMDRGVGTIGEFQSFRSQTAPVFDPPIRIYRNVTFSIQFIGTPAPLGFVGTDMIASILYRERPKVSQ